MTEFQEWFHEKQVERTVNALRKNNFDAQFAPTTQDALVMIFKMIPDGAMVGVGGSVTLSQIGFFDEAVRRSVKVLNPPGQPLSPEEFIETRR